MFSKIEKSSLFRISIVLLVAMLVRVAYFLYVEQPIMAGDSGRYINSAKEIASGFSQGNEYVKNNLLYQFYPLLLTLGAFLKMDSSVYIMILHILLSTLTVGFISATATRISDPIYGFAVGILAAFHPLFIFWMPYILSEIGLLFSLSVFSYLWTWYYEKPNAIRAIVILFGVGFVITTKPSSLAIIPTTAICLFISILRERYHFQLGKSLCYALGLFLLITCIGIALLWKSPKIRYQFFSQLTVSEQLNHAARLSSSNFDEYFAVDQETADFAATLKKGLSVEDVRFQIAMEALRIIESDPAKYIRFCIKRGLSFWFPGIYQGRWSLPHTLVDFFIGFFLLAGALLSLLITDANRKTRYTLCFFAFSYALLHTFTYMDSDGRYRLPAELFLLIIAPQPFYVKLKTWLWYFRSRSSLLRATEIPA